MDDLTVDHCYMIDTIVIGQWTIMKGQRNFIMVQ